MVTTSSLSTINRLKHSIHLGYIYLIKFKIKVNWIDSIIKVQWKRLPYTICKIIIAIIMNRWPNPCKIRTETFGDFFLLYGHFRIHAQWVRFLLRFFDFFPKIVWRMTIILERNSSRNQTYDFQYDTILKAQYQLLSDVILHFYVFATI